MKIGKYEIKMRSVDGRKRYYLEDTKHRCSTLTTWNFMTPAILTAYELETEQCYISHFSIFTPTNPPE